MFSTLHLLPKHCHICSQGSLSAMSCSKDYYVFCLSHFLLHFPFYFLRYIFSNETVKFFLSYIFCYISYHFFSVTFSLKFAFEPCHTVKTVTFALSYVFHYFFCDIFSVTFSHDLTVMLSLKSSCWSCYSCFVIVQVIVSVVILYCWSGHLLTRLCHCTRDGISMERHCLIVSLSRCLIVSTRDDISMERALSLY